MEDPQDLPPAEFVAARRPRVLIRAALMHVGLLMICASAILTPQPSTLTHRRWAAMGLLALVILLSAAVTRGRLAFQTAGKFLTALAAVSVLSLSYDPQLASIPAAAAVMPPWLAAIGPGLGTLGVVWAAVFGLSYLNTVDSYVRHRHLAPFVWGLNAALLVVAGLGIVSYLCLGRLYELDPTLLPLLLGNVIQYYLLLRVVLSVSGRVGVGSSLPVYLALTILAAAARSLLAGGGAQ